MNAPTPPVPTAATARYTRGAALPAILQQRIAIIDGAMGTMIQRHRLGEADFRNAALAEHPTHGDAEAHVLEHGLAVLAEHWWYRPHADAEWQIACIVEARPGAVRLALDYYPMPGVAMVTVTAEDLAQGVGLTRSVD